MANYTGTFFYHQTAQKLKQANEIYANPAKNIKSNHRVKRGETFISVEHQSSNEPMVHYQAPFDIKVIAIPEPNHYEETGEIMTLRADFPIDEENKEKLKDFLWGDYLKQLALKKQAQALRAQREADKRKEIADIERLISTLSQQIAIEKDKKRWSRKLREKANAGISSYLIWIILTISVGVSEGDTEGFMVGVFAFFIIPLIAFGAYAVASLVTVIAESIILRPDRDKTNALYKKKSEAQLKLENLSTPTSD